MTLLKTVIPEVFLQLAAARLETDELSEGKQNSRRKQKEIHLINLNEDPMLSGVICHFLKAGEATVGRKDATPLPDICLSGLR